MSQEDWIHFAFSPGIEFFGHTTSCVFTYLCFIFYWIEFNVCFAGESFKTAVNEKVPMADFRQHLLMWPSFAKLTFFLEHVSFCQ
jgi:hypothetical protein